MNTKTVIHTRTPFNTVNAALGVILLGTITVCIFGFSLSTANDIVSPLFLEWLIVGLAGSLSFGSLLGYFHVPAKMVKIVPYVVVASCAILFVHIYYIF